MFFPFFSNKYVIYRSESRERYNSTDLVIHSVQSGRKKSKAGIMWMGIGQVEKMTTHHIYKHQQDGADEDGDCKNWHAKNSKHRAPSSLNCSRNSYKNTNFKSIWFQLRKFVKPHFSEKSCGHVVLTFGSKILSKSAFFIIVGIHTKIQTFSRTQLIEK